MKNDHNISNTTTRTSTSVRRLSAPAATRRSIVKPANQQRPGGRGPWGQGKSVALAIALGWLALASQASAQVENVPPASAPSKNPAAAADQKATKPKTAKVSKDAAKATAHTGVTAAQAASPAPIAMPDAAPAPATPAPDSATAPAAPAGNGTPNSALLDPLQAPLTGQPLPPLNPLANPADASAPAQPPVSPEQAQANVITSALDKEKADFATKSAQFEQVKDVPADKLVETLMRSKLDDDAMRQQERDVMTARTALEDLKKQNLPETDPQVVAANDQVKKVTGLLQQAAESRREALGIDVDVLKVKIANHEKELAALQAKTGQPGANGAAAADDKTPVGDIRDIRPPVLIPDAWMWVIYTAVSLLAAAIAGTVGYYLWKKYRSRKIVLLPHELALKRLDKARELMAPETAREYTFAVSEAARQYIESRFEAKAAHRTTEEFLRDLIDTRNQTSPLTGYSSLLEEFLNHCDLVKFARWSLTTPEMERMHESARKFVLETMPMAARAHRNGAATKHDPPVAPPGNPPAVSLAQAAENTRVGAP